MDDQSGIEERRGGGAFRTVAVGAGAFLLGTLGLHLLRRRYAPIDRATRDRLAPRQAHVVPTAADIRVG